MSDKLVMCMKAHSDASNKMLLHMNALYKLPGTHANTQLMHWYVLSEKIGNVTKCSV